MATSHSPYLVRVLAIIVKSRYDLNQDAAQHRQSACFSWCWRKAEGCRHFQGAIASVNGDRVPEAVDLVHNFGHILAVIHHFVGT
jgi:hypothetical protein